MANSVDPDQNAPIEAVYSGSTLFASILNLPVMLSKYLQQTASADDIFRCIFFSWRFKGSIDKSTLHFSVDGTGTHLQRARNYNASLKLRKTLVKY